MLIQTEIEKVNFDEWSERIAHWGEKSASEINRRKRRERETNPLIITGYGFTIKVERQRLVIREGLTHYPQKIAERAYFKGSLDLPPRILIVDGKGTISIDALDWLAEQGIALIRIKYDGSSAIVMAPTGFAADPDKVAWQYKTREDAAAKLAFATKLTREKLVASIETLEGFIPPSKAQQQAVAAARECIAFVDRGDADTSAKLLGQEGKAASLYWRAWQGLDMKWRTSKRYPIPDAWREFKSRSSVNNGSKTINRNADHPINAMLNYAYAALITKMRIQAIADGYDPMIGILHDQRERSKELTPSFALDLMEPHRPVVDRGVLKLIREETFSGVDFDLQSDGVVRVGPGLVRRLVGAVGHAL